MSGNASFRLSRETRDLLKQHQDFFSSVLDLYDGKGDNPQKTPLKFKPSDLEAKTEAEVKPNGDIEVTFIIPLDDNEKAGDGRVYLKDKFVFDPTQKVLKGYQRSFEHNGKGDVAAWKGWLGKYEALVKNGPGLSDKLVQSFGLSVARTFGQAMVDEQEQPLEKFKEAFKKERRYLDSLNGLIVTQAKRFDLEGLKLRRDKESHYQVIRDGDQLDLILKWVADDDAKPENGRIWLKDRFTFKDGKFTNFSRDWLSDPKAESAEKHRALVESLKRQPPPDMAETKAFAENLQPYLVPQQNPNPRDLTPLLAASLKAPAGESLFKVKDPAGLDAAQKQALQILEVFAKEDVAKRADHAEGLLNFESKVDVNAEITQVESLFKKLAEARDQSPAGNLKTLLQGLSLSEGEQAQRQRLLKSALFRELLSLAQERDTELRHGGLLHLAKGRLFSERGYPGTATAIASLLKDDSALGAKAGKLLDLANGKANFGDKLEMTLGHFQHEVTKPSMLAGMMAAPFAGAAFEIGGLRAAKYLYDAKKIESIGRGTKLAASGFGVFGESVAFTGMHRGFERLSHGSDRTWNGAGDEILSSMLMFVGMRAVHAGTGWASSRAAEGKFNFKVREREIRFGGREGTAAHGPNLFQPTPTGRLLMGNPWVPEAGVGAPTLTKLGQFSAGTANHLGSIFAMQASSAVSRKAGWMPDNDQTFAANFFDATVMYGQAMVGFNLANRATMGRLQPALGEVKMRIEGFDPKASYAPIAPERPAKSGGGFEFGPWLQKIRASRAAAKTAAAPKPAGEAEGWGARVRQGLGSAREWLSKLGPSKVRNLEAQLAEVEAKRAEAEREVETKTQAITELEARVTELGNDLGSAQGEAANQRSEAEAKGTRIGELERELGEKNTEVAERTRQLEAAKEETRQEKEAREAAEGKLQEIENNAEAADLGLSFENPAAEAAALRQKIQVLNTEKSEAQIRAAASGQEATELRGQIETANAELKRREGIDRALTEAQTKVGELETARTEFEATIAELRRDIDSRNKENTAASELVGRMAQQISDLETSVGRKDKALTEGAAEIQMLREQVETTRTEAQMLADKLGESDAQLKTANHQLETERSRVEQLNRVQKALERERGEIQSKLDAKSGEASELSGKLRETDASLTEVQRELKGARLDLETAERVKNGKDAENERLRGLMREAQANHGRKETELSESIRGLEDQVKQQMAEIETAATTVEGLRRDLGEQTSRAEGAEARETTLRAEIEELQSQHEQTKTDLSKAERLLRIAESTVQAKERQLEREKSSKASMLRNLNALRNRKGELDRELIDAKAEKSRLETRAKELERQLQEEIEKEPEIDITAQVELSEARQEFEEQKGQLEGRIQALETNRGELEGKIKTLEREKGEAERRVRSLETDVEMAKGSAQSQKDDLEALQTRTKKEAEELRASMEAWRKKATDAEGGKARAEARVATLESDLSGAKTRLESAERELREQGEVLRAERAKSKKLETQVGELDGAKQELESQIQIKAAEMATAASEARDQIEQLTREKGEQEAKLKEREETASRLREELGRKSEALTKAEKDARDAKDETRRERARLDGEKRAVERERDAKIRELTNAETEAGNLRTQVQELEERIGQVRREAEAEQERLNSENGALKGDLETKERDLIDLQRQLAESEARAEELDAQLGEANRSLEAEKTALTNLRAEVEETEARNGIALDRLREEARIAEQAREEAEGKAREANAKLSQVETELGQVRRKAEGAEQEAKTKLGRSEQRAETAEGHLAERTRELEELRTSTAAEAERLRDEALQASRNEALAQARVEEVEATSALAAQRLQTLEAELAGAQAQVEALQAPASQHEASAARATRLAGELAIEKQKLTAAEARATAAEQKVTATEERVRAAEARAEAEKARAEAALLRATEAEGKAEHAETELGQKRLRILGLEGDLTQAQAENVTLARAAEEYETQAKPKIAKLEARARELEGQAQAAETRAQEAETRAADAERAALDLDQQILTMAKSLSAAKDAEAAANQRVEDLLREKSELQNMVRQRETSIAELEGQALQRIAERTQLEAQVEAGKTQIGRLEARVRELEAEIDRVNGDITQVWEQSQATGQESVEQRASLEEQRGKIESLEIDLELAREELRVAKDAQETVRLLEIKENELIIQTRTLEGERNDALRRIEELERELDNAGVGVDPEVALAAYNLRSSGVGEGYFHRVDPRAEKVSLRVKDSVVLRQADGAPAGEAKIVAGGEQGDLTLEFLDGSTASARTTKAGRKYQEDGAYMARFKLPDGREVKVLAGSDGAGGHESGDLASSSFLQGVHARVAEAVHEGRIPSAGELFEHGELALSRQKPEPTAQEEHAEGGKLSDPTGTGAVIVMVGNEATIATKGDSNILWARPNAAGEFEVLGITETDATAGDIGKLNIRKYNNIVRGIGIESNPATKSPRLYGVQGIRQGDRVLIGSDGFWGVTVGPALVEATSSELRQLPRPFGEADQNTFDHIRWGLKASSGQSQRAEAWHDLALQQMRNPGTERSFFGEQRRIDVKDDADNVFVIDLEQGLVTPNAQSIIPQGYGKLWPVHSLAETQRRAAMAKEVVQPKTPSPVPPPLPSQRSKVGIQQDLANKYTNTLAELYGTVAEAGRLRLSPSGNEAAKQFVELYYRYPELEAQISPELLQAADRVGQIKLFDVAERFLQDVKKADAAKGEAAIKILRTIKGLSKVFTKAGPEELAQVQAAHGTLLHRMFGAEGSTVAQAFANLHKAAPDIADLFNPATLASPTLFNLNYFYREINQKIMESDQPYQPPTPAEVAAVQAKYQASLDKVFGEGEGAAQAASWFAGLHKSVPSTQHSYNPDTIASKKFVQQLMRYFSIDGILVRPTDSTPGTDAGPIGYAADIKNIAFSQETQTNRAARGWSNPESWANGIRSWDLAPGENHVYRGGRNQGHIVLEEPSVSSQHFAISSRGKDWILEEVEARNGIFVNEKELKSGKSHKLKNGDKLRFGHVELQWSVNAENQGRLVALRPHVLQNEAPAPRPGQPAAAAPQARPAAAPAPVAPVADPTPSGRMVFRPSPDAPFILGYDQIPDYGVSPNHLQIRKVHGKWYIQDLGSNYGTRLNGQDIQAEMIPRKEQRPPGKEHVLEVGHSVQLGNLHFQWDGAQLVQTGGSIVPPSTQYYRPSPNFRPRPLQAGETVPLVLEGQQIGLIQWDQAKGQFLLRNSIANTQLWVHQQGQNYPLNDSCILTNGMIFGMGASESTAQYYIFRDNVLTAITLKGSSHNHQPAASFQAPLHLEFPVTDPLGIRLGRQQFRDHPSLSGEHLDFRRNGNQWEVRDAGSLNGTYLNGERISVGDPSKGDPRKAGEWKPVKSGDIVTVGQFNMRFHAEGNNFSLDEVPQTSSEPPNPGPIPMESFASSYRPSPTSGSRQPQADVSQLDRGVVPMHLGDSRIILVGRRGGDAGLYLSDPQQPLNGEFFLNLGRGAGLLSAFRDKALFRLERLEGDRYRLTNIDAKSGLVITNDRGANRQVAAGNADQVVPGDTVVLDGGKLRINLAKDLKLQ
ncbi:MAG TPA: FHA domain-containing protein [bacterium]|nr:FHA domain-containing protein [bacterium]